MTKPKAVHFTPAPAPAEAGPYDDPHAESVRRGVDDADNGRVVDGGRVRAWLRSWGTGNETDPPAR